MRRDILAIALPAVVSNLTTPVLGLVDVAISGHIGESLYIGAIAVGGAVFNMLYWIFNFIRMSTTGLTAQACGAADGNAQRIVLFRALVVAAAVGVFLLIAGSLAGGAIMAFMDADGPTTQLALDYFSICIWGAPAVIGTYALAGWFLGMQNSRAQMWMAIVTNIVNIALSTTLVFGLGMKIEGLATGTMTAQWVGFILGVGILIFRYRPTLPSWGAIMNFKALTAFFRINTDIFLRTLCLVCVTVWFTHAGARQGNEILSANALLLQLFMLFSFFMDGFAFAGEALSGKHAGADDYDSLRRLIRVLIRIGLWCALIFALVYALCGEWILNLLAEDKTVVGCAASYLPWAVALPLCGFAAFVWDGIFVGLIRTRAMLVSMAGALAVFFSVYVLSESALHNHGLWLAFDAYLLTRGLLEALIYKKSKASPICH